MAALSKTYVITNGTTADASQVEQDFLDVQNYINSNTMRIDGANQMTAQLKLLDSDPTNTYGAVRKAYFDGPVALAHGGVSQNFSSGLPSVVLFSIEDRDADNGANTATNYNLATGVFTAPKTGLYVCAFTVAVVRFTSIATIEVLAGGTVYSGPSVQTDLVQSVGNPQLSMSLAVYVTATQTIAPRLTLSSGTSGISVGKNLSIHWVHA